MGEIHNINTARRFMLHVQGKAGPKFGRLKEKRRQLFTSFPDRWEEALSERSRFGPDSGCRLRGWSDRCREVRSRDPVDL
jgi:hypothetical protein